MNTALHETKPNIFIYVNGIIMDSEMSMKRNNHSTVFPSRYYHDCTLLLHEHLLLPLMAERTRDLCYL